MIVTRVYKYGLLAPIDGADAVANQFRKRHEYKISLAKAISEHRAAQLQCIKDHQPVELESINKEISNISERIDEAVKTRNDARIRLRSKKTPIETAALKALQTEKKQLIAKKKELAVGLDMSARKAAMKALDDAWVAKTKELRKPESRGEELHDGTYNPVEAEIQQATKTTHLSQDTVRIFATRINKLGQQIHSTRPLTYADLFANTDKRVGIMRGEGKRVILRVQIQTKPTSVCAQFPMIMHRDLPEGGEIKRVDVVRKQIGTRSEWTALFTVQMSAPERRAETATTIGIDIGWRKQANGDILVATTSNGERLVVPARILAGLQKVRDLQEIRDKNAIEAAKLIESKIISARSLLRKYYELGKPESLAAWYKQERHLWEWQENLRSRTVRHRRDLERNYAARLAQKYQSVIFEDMDGNRFKTVDEGSKYILQAVAPFELREVIIAKFQLDAWYTNPAYTTQTCNACKTRNDVAENQTEVTCTSCGATYDRDHNAAKNIREWGIDAISAGTARNCIRLEPMKKIQRRRGVKLE